MKKLVLIFSLLLFSNNLLAFVDLPEGCWSRAEKPCSVRASKNEWLEFKNGTRVFLSGGSSFLSTEEFDLKILAGQVWIESEKNIRLLVLEKIYEINGHFWFKKSQNEQWVQVFVGQIQSLDFAKSELIPAGFEKWWKLDAESLVMPIGAQEKIFRDWNRFLQLEKNEASSRIAEYKKAWMDRAERGARLYQALVDRKIATAESRVEQHRRRQLKKQQEQELLREQFRKKFYNP